jgi:hypothetical protein
MNCLILAALLVFMQAPSQLAGMVIETPTNEIHVVQLPSDWSPHKDWFDYIGWGAGVMLAFAGVIGVCFAYRTLRTLQHQTIATRKAAEAARLNAQAVINAERPWVVVTEKREGTAGIASIFYSRVRGRTPAIIISNWADHIYVDDPQHLPIPPRYGDEGAVFAAQPLVTSDDTPSIAFQFSSDLTLKALTEEKRSRINYMEEWLCVYGRVRYTDLLAKDAQGRPVVHETRWCYVYYPSEPGTFVKDGPPVYNSYT